MHIPAVKTKVIKIDNKILKLVFTSETCPITNIYFPVTYAIGSVVAPFFLTSKWRCGPVDTPVEPTFAIT